eukprot:TRINITY_DN3007_c0_g1_i1.p1 TRINITY_DN3007_c0_g1~~TRINITY_DN3007_c0_g1_i1.p1  ORF type:complete len:252 (-),score=52.83 TRINITY_DN3007_c0_g1_i1:206-961(-)
MTKKHFDFVFFFFFQAEDGIRDAQESRGLGDVYKRQVSTQSTGVVTQDNGVFLNSALMLSAKFYQNLYDVSNAGKLGKRDTTGLSAICLLPPRVTIRPATADAARAQPSHPSRARPATSSHQNDKRTSRSRERSRPSSAGGTKLKDYLLKPDPKSKSKSRPKSAASSVGGPQEQEFQKLLTKHRCQPVHPSRKLWNRINPGHMMEEWKTTHKVSACPEFKRDPNYTFKKEHHNPKSEFLYIPKKKPIVTKS